MKLKKHPIYNIYSVAMVQDFNILKETQSDKTKEIIVLIILISLFFVTCYNAI